MRCIGCVAVPWLGAGHPSCKGVPMSEMAALYAQEMDCQSRVDELVRVLDSLADFRNQVNVARADFEGQLDDKVRRAYRASDLSGRLAKKYAEKTVGYLTGEFGRNMAYDFAEVDAQAAAATIRVDEELDEELARLASIRERIRAERAREQVVQAARQAEQVARRSGKW